MKSFVLRQAAEHDIDKSFTDYLDQANAEVAKAFIEAVDEALNHIANFPCTGSPRYGELLEGHSEVIVSGLT
jgi:toxin ParE1/3/4